MEVAVGALTIVLFGGVLAAQLVYLARKHRGKCKPGGNCCGAEKQGRTRKHTCVRILEHGGEHMCNCGRRW